MATTDVNTRLRELDSSGYEVVDDQPNVLGWTVKDNNGRKLGVVEDLLFDPELRKVRYIIMSTKGNDFDLEKRRVIVPIGLAEIHERHDDILLPQILLWQVRALPTYTKGKLTQYDEQDIHNIFSGNSTGAVAGAALQPIPANFYEHSQFNQENLYRNRRKSKIVDQPMERTFRLREDTKTPPVAVDTVDDTASASREDQLVNRVRRLESELEDLKRELRMTRQDSDQYIGDRR